jgi:hypothetical protein
MDFGRVHIENFEESCLSGLLADDVVEYLKLFKI